MQLDWHRRRIRPRASAQLVVTLLAMLAWGPTPAQAASEGAQLVLPRAWYRIVSPYRYEESRRWERGWNRGADAFAHEGQVRSPVPGRVRFAGLVAGRHVVTVDATVGGRSAVVTFTGLDAGRVRVGDRLSAGAVVGLRRGLVHVGAWDAGRRTRYLPVAAEAPSPPGPVRGAGDRSQGTPTIADVIGARLLAAITGDAALPATARVGAARRDLGPPTAGARSGRPSMPGARARADVPTRPVHAAAARAGARLQAAPSADVARLPAQPATALLRPAGIAAAPSPAAHRAGSLSTAPAAARPARGRAGIPPADSLRPTWRRTPAGIVAAGPKPAGSGARPLPAAAPRRGPGAGPVPGSRAGERGAAATLGEAASIGAGVARSQGAATGAVVAHPPEAAGGGRSTRRASAWTDGRTLLLGAVSALVLVLAMDAALRLGAGARLRPRRGNGRGQARPATAAPLPPPLPVMVPRPVASRHGDMGTCHDRTSQRQRLARDCARRSPHELLRDDADLLRELDAPPGPRVHDDRGGRDHPLPAAGRR